VRCVCGSSATASPPSRSRAGSAPLHASNSPPRHQTTQRPTRPRPAACSPRSCPRSPRSPPPALHHWRSRQPSVSPHHATAPTRLLALLLALPRVLSSSKARGWGARVQQTLALRRSAAHVHAIHPRATMRWARDDPRTHYGWPRGGDATRPRDNQRLRRSTPPSRRRGALRRSTPPSRRHALAPAGRASPSARRWPSHSERGRGPSRRL